MLKKFVLGTIAAVVLAACGGEGSNSASSAPAQSGAASGSLIETYQQQKAPSLSAQRHLRTLHLP